MSKQKVSQLTVSWEDAEYRKLTKKQLAEIIDSQNKGFPYKSLLRMNKESLIHLIKLTRDI